MLRSYRLGFALIELLIAMAILGILVGLSVTALSPTRNIESANEQKIQVEINQLEARVRDWQIAGGELTGLTERWQPLCRYKELPGPNDPTCVWFDGVQDDGYVKVIPFRTTSQSPYTGYEARTQDGIVEVRAMFWPRDIPGLVLWLDAEDPVVISSGARTGCIGDCLNWWKDKSGGTPLITTQSTPRRAPLNGGTINGVNAIAFFETGTAADWDVLTLQPKAPTRLDLRGGRDEMEVVIVLEPQSVSESAVVLAKSWGGGVQYEFRLNAGRASARIGNGTLVSDTTTVADGKPHFFTWSVGLSDIDIWQDINHTAHMANAVGPYFTDNLDVLLGTRRAGKAPPTNGSSPSEYYYGDLGEVIIYNRKLSDDERTKLHQDLAEKWKIQKAPFD